MLTLKCTRSVQGLLGLKPDEMIAETNGESLLGAWYVNAFMVDRRKTFIFMSERTLLSFVLFGAKKANTTKGTFPDIFLGGLDQLLRMETFGLEQIGRVIEDCFESRYAATNSKSALGNMNDLVWHYQHRIASGGGLAGSNLAEIIMQVNRMPQRNLGGGTAIDATREILSASAT